jgi:transcriptional regulator with XRE-family HTH domain
VSVGTTIKLLRGERPQEDLAHEAGISTSTLSRLERGLHQPSLPTLRKLATALDVSVAELMRAAEVDLAKQVGSAGRDKPIDRASSRRS